MTKRLFDSLCALAPALRPSDVKRLSHHLRSSGRLSDLLTLDTVSTEDLQRMLLVEGQKKKPRYVIVRKLIARILSRERARMLHATYGPKLPTP